MRRELIFGVKFALAFALCATVARGQAIPVSGNLQDLGANNATAPTTYVQFTLQNYGSTIPMITGTNAFVSPTPPILQPNNVGQISGTIVPNTLISPANTYYQVCIFNQGVSQWCQNYLISTTPSPWNLNSAVPIVTIPPPPAPFLAVLLNPLGTQNIVQPGGTSITLNGLQLATFSGSFTPGNCLKSLAGPTIADAGAPCGSGGGGGGTPGGSDTQTQINHAGAFAGFSGLGVNNSSSPTGYTVPFNFDAAGPRPSIDVTAPGYGADPTGATDSTTAIQSAITAACTTGGSVFLPPGDYHLTQPQTPSNATVFQIPCISAHIVGGNAAPSTKASGSRAPDVRLIVTNAGASPNAMPVFGLGDGYNCAGGVWPCTNSNLGLSTNGGTTLENLNITGYNQALGIWGANVVHLNNVSLTVNAHGQTDNAALRYSNSFWLFVDGGVWNTNGAIPVAIWSMETPSQTGESPVVGLVHVQNVILSGGKGIQYIQRVANAGPISGDWNLEFLNLENSATPFLTFSNTSGSSMQVSGISMNQIVMSDVTGGPQPLVLFNGASSSDQLFGLNINQSDNSNSAPLVQITGGANLTNYQVNGCLFACGNQVVGSTGNPIGSGQIQDLGGGVDYVDNVTGQNSQAFLSSLNGTSARFFEAGNLFAFAGADANGGFLLNDGASYGFSASLSQTTKETADIMMAKLLPPTSVTETAVGGGGLAAGTYYAWVSSTIDGCNTNANMSAISNPSSSLVLGGANASITVGWTVPIASGAPFTGGGSTGYCVEVSTVVPPAYPVGAANFFVAGASTTSLTITTLTGAFTSNPVYNTLVPVHRFTATGLNVSGGVNEYTDTGAANAYIVTPSPALTVITPGFWTCFLPANSSTGASTLVIGSAGAVAIQKNGGLAIVSGDIVAGHRACVDFNGTTFDLLNPAGTASVLLQTGGTNNGVQNTLNMIPSTTNAIGGVITPVNATSTEKFELTGLIAAVGGGTGVVNPAVNSVAVSEGSGPFHFIAPGLSGQAFTALNGGDPYYSSPGIPRGNAGAIITTSGPYIVACDSATTLLDRSTILEFSSGSAQTATFPDPTLTGCGSNFSFRFIVKGAGTVTWSRAGSALINYCVGSSCTLGATSAAFSTGNFCLFNASDNANWTGECVTSSGGTGANQALSNLSAVAINTTLLPASAGSANIGTAALPFGDVFIGGTASEAFDFNVSALTGDRTVTVPNANTVLTQPLAFNAHQFVTSLSSTTGLLGTAQVGFGDLSGTATVGQGGTGAISFTNTCLLEGTGTTPVICSNETDNGMTFVVGNGLNLDVTGDLTNIAGITLTGFGISGHVSTVSLTAQNANISAASFGAQTWPAGRYVAQCYSVITTSGTGGTSPKLQIVLGWTDAATTQSAGVATATINSGQEVNQNIYIVTSGTNNITYAANITGSPTGNPTFNLSCDLFRMQ